MVNLTSPCSRVTLREVPSLDGGQGMSRPEEEEDDSGLCCCCCCWVVSEVVCWWFEDLE